MSFFLKFLKRRQKIQDVIRVLHIDVFNWVIPCSFPHFCRMAQERCAKQGISVSYEEMSKHVNRYQNEQAKKYRKVRR